MTEQNTCLGISNTLALDQERMSDVIWHLCEPTPSRFSASFVVKILWYYPPQEKKGITCPLIGYGCDPGRDGKRDVAGKTAGQRSVLVTKCQSSI
mmetsp:Transcript_15181/g.32138  ORF Transcript_15181/g.32138 Transcript_15181/m.32138 type:complete len:95 (-) Transcript_15181:102-386(-)